jgi:hypothetical protein
MVLLKNFVIIFYSKEGFTSRTSGTNFKFLETVKSDGITVIEQIHEHATPNAPVSDKVRISAFAPSVRKRNGIAPATVVPVVARSAGIFFRGAR